MKSKLIAILLGTSLLLSMGVTPVSAEVIIQNGQPQSASVSYQTYIDQGWSGYPDYQQQVVNPRDIFEGPTDAERQMHEQDGSWSLSGACESTAVLWMYNWKGIHPEATMWSMNRTLAMDQYLVSGGFKDGFNILINPTEGMSNETKIQKYKDFLDKGCLLYAAHPQLIVGYAVKDGKTWFEVMQTEYAAQPNEKWHMWISEADILQLSIKVIGKDLSVTPINCTYTAKDGSDKSTIVYMDKLGIYYYSLDTLADFFPDLTTEKINWYKSKISNVNGASNTILQRNTTVNINNQAYGMNDKLKIINQKITSQTEQELQKDYTVAAENGMDWINLGGGNWKLKNKNGSYVNGWITISGKKYYFDLNGKMAYGLQTIDGSLYMFEHNGALKNGWSEMQRNGYMYFVNGKPLVNATTPDGYCVDSYGYWYDGNGKEVLLKLIETDRKRTLIAEDFLK